MTKGVFLYGLYLASTVAHYVLEIVETDYQSSGKLSTHHIPPPLYTLQHVSFHQSSVLLHLVPHLRPRLAHAQI